MADINPGEILEALNEKMDRNANNITKPYLPVFLVATQRPTAANNYTWYRLYSDGWVEQGQNYLAIGSNRQSFSLIITMSDNKYNLQLTGLSGANQTSTDVGIYVSSYARTTNSFTVYSGDDASFNTSYFCWYVCGMAA